MAKAELSKLQEIFKVSEQEMATLEGGHGPVQEVLGKVRKAMQEVRAIAGSLGIKGLVRLGQELEKLASQSSLSPEDLTTLTFAVGSMKSGLADGTYEGLRSALMETLELVGVEPLDVMSVTPAKPAPKKPVEESFKVQRIEKPKAKPAPAPPPPPPPEPEPEPEPVPEPPPPEPMSQEEVERVENLERVAGQLGGKIVFSGEPGAESFKLELPTSSLDRVSVLLSPLDPAETLTQKLSADDEHLKKVVDTVKEFMASFAEGNLEKAQEVLEELAGFEGGGELYSEIGGLARELHDSLAGLAETLTSDLQEMVEADMPDTGNRLEHILKITDEAATTTLDHAESIKQRIAGDQQKLERLERHLSMLKPIGDSAHNRMDESAQLIRELKESLTGNYDDVSIILTSQGYQDLTGQIINKIVGFQKGIEDKLIGLIRSFGARISKGKKKQKKEELYGPAHENVKDAVHSQDEVDAILAEFGF